MRRARNEDGFAVVTAILLLAVILGLGLGLLQFADAQQKASTREQASEAAFNVAEAALNAQVGQLDREWPTEKNNPNPNNELLPLTCTAGTSTKTNDCPSPTDLEPDPNTGSTACSGRDAWGSPLSNQWTTYVRQDVIEGLGASAHESSLFNSTAERSLPSYASSDAGALWVRAVGVVQCHPVTVISLVTRQRVTLRLPEGIAGNWFKVTNKGNKDIVNRIGISEGQAAPVSMRCEPVPAGQKECEEYDRSKEQVSPPITPNEPKSPGMTLTPTELETIKSEAQAYGKFYSTASYHCPTGTSMEELEGTQLPTGSRAPVYIEGCGAVKITANGMANCEPPKPVASTPHPESPGFLVVANGTFELSGKSTYCGVIYAANLNPQPLSEEAIVKLQGGTVVVGGIIVDGEGGIEFGSSGQGGNPANLVFDSRAIRERTISAGAASTRNSFRILPAGQ